MLPDLFDLTLPRCAPNTSLIFSDESSQNKRFCVLGALYLWLPSGDYKRHIARLESKLTKLKADYGLGTVKWEKVPRPGRMLEGYKALVGYLASLRERVKFKCMVVDTHAYPLDHATLYDRDSLVGYLKYYTVFLTDGIMLTQRGYFYDITIDDYSWRPKTGHDSKALGEAVERRYVRKSRKAHLKQRHSQLAVANEEESNLLQLTDILAGAVAFCRNSGRDRTSGRSVGMKELADVIQKSYGGVKLDGQQQYRGPFVVWNFVDREDGGLSLTARGEVVNYP
jgi:hypothetical protein